MELSVVGLNHKRASVELRERVAVPPEALEEMLAAVRTELGAQETVILSTCNRVEVYAVHAESPVDAVPFLARRHGLAPEALTPLLYRHEGLDTALHLFRVASGMDSMVVGETQILGQVKDAYQKARDAGHTGRVLNRLFQTAFHVAKKIHGETTVVEKSVSVPSVAARLAGKIFSDLTPKTLLILGAGETGRLALHAFRERGVSRILVVNRTIEHARELTDNAYALEALSAVLPRADIVIACITLDGYAITPELIQAALKARRQEPMFLLDIAVPRNIHPEVNRLDNVYLFNIDDLQEIVSQNLREREKEIESCTPILEEAAQSVMAKLETVDLDAVLAQLRETSHQIGEEEAKKTLQRLRELDAGAREEITYLVQRVINRLLHAPTTALQREARNGDSFNLIELTARLFGLGGRKK